MGERPTSPTIYHANRDGGIAMTSTVKDIIEAKRRAGESAFLWLTHTGICALYDREEDSYDSGTPVRRWELDPIEREQIIETGLVDGVGAGEENALAASLYQTIKGICSQEIQGGSPTDPALFNRITAQLGAAGIEVDQVMTAAARAESPNIVTVFTEWPDEQAYIEIVGDEVDVYPYEAGEVLAELVTFSQIQDYYNDPPITLEDLADLRHLERDGLKFYDESDINSLSEAKTTERKGRREELRNMTLVLPDEFLALCEGVDETPAAVLQGFIADLCHLEESPYITNGSDERLFAEEYFDRCGYRARAEWAREEAEKTCGSSRGAHGEKKQ